LSFSYLLEFPDSGHPDSEKLVEIGRVNSKELQSLEQRNGGVAGLLQNPVIKREPGDIPIGIWQDTHNLDSKEREKKAEKRRYLR
jgi:hypothetical protein